MKRLLPLLLLFPALAFGQMLKNLPVIPSQPTGPENVPCDQSNVTYKCTVTQINGALYPVTAAEIAASVTPTLYIYPEGDLRRYGGVGDQSTNNYNAITTALTVANQPHITGGSGNGVVYVPGGIFRFTPPGIAAGTTYTSASQSTITGVFTTPSQSPPLTAGTMVTCSSTCPTGFSPGVIYFVIQAGLGLTTVELSATSGGSVLIPSGSSATTLTVETGIEVPTGVTIQGTSRANGYSVFQPYHSGSLYLDGNGPKGGNGFVQEISIRNLEVDFQYAIATNVAYVNNAYSVKMADLLFNGGFSNVPTFTNAVGVYGSNGRGDFDDILDNVSIYGNSGHIASSPVCLNIIKSAGQLKMLHLDIEYCATGIYNASTNSSIDFISPYSESTTLINYSHNTTNGGVTTFVAGELIGGTGQASVININGDNLIIQGTLLSNFTTSAFQVPANSLTGGTGTSFKNVKLNGINLPSGSAALAANANFAAADFGNIPSVYAMSTQTAYDSKALTSGTPANIFSFYSGTGVMSCKVRVMAYQSSGGLAATVGEYLMVIANNGLGNQAAPGVEATHQAINSTVNTLTLSSPTLNNPSNNYYTFGITATETGSGGTGHSVKSYSKAECMSYDNNVPGGMIIVAD